MADPLITREQVEAYLSTPVVTDTLDDDNDGTIDDAASDMAIRSSQAIFLATIRGLYELPLVAPIDPFVETVILQLVHCQLIRRFPERFKRGVKICEEVAELLKAIRAGEMQLDHPVRGDGFVPVCGSLEPRGYESLEPNASDE